MEAGPVEEPRAPGPETAPAPALAERAEVRPEDFKVEDLDGWQAAVLEGVLAPLKEPAEPQLPPSPEKPGEVPRLVVYRFASGSELGGLGRDAARNITGHAARSGLFQTFPEVIFEEIMDRSPFGPTPDTEIEQVAGHASGNFRADIAIWGEVKGTRKSPVLSVVAIDLRGARESLILREEYPCPNIHYIPMAAERILAACLGLRREERQVKRERYLSGNLVEAPAEGILPEGVRLSGEAGAPRLVFDLTRRLAESTGLGTYTRFADVEPGAYYEFSFKVRSGGPAVIVWAKGYARFPDQRREVYRHQVRARDAREGEWTEVTSAPFRPMHPRYRVQWLRLKLYAYLRAGRVEFKDVVLRKVKVVGGGGEEEHMRKAFGGKGPGG